MRLKFVPPPLPTLVEKLPESGVWLHEVKFDGYRSQMIVDESGTRIQPWLGLHGEIPRPGRRIEVARCGQRHHRR
ncbi:hypothetical protein [Mesorhizobium sp.]|uniref:hypothetical protein n=1 Tax=Mesorhizobium sp. TaxID=1871066 RepID=UPI0025C4A85F|nr:hypothetical protein [Mesorhizobium sp.]